MIFPPLAQRALWVEAVGFTQEPRGAHGLGGRAEGPQEAPVTSPKAPVHFSALPCSPLTNGTPHTRYVGPPLCVFPLRNVTFSEAGKKGGGGTSDRQRIPFKM